MSTNDDRAQIVGGITCGPYVSVMDRQHWPNVQTEMMRLLDECARLGKEIERLKAAFSWLSDWHGVPGQSENYGDYGLNFIDRDEEGFYIDDTNLQTEKGVRFETVLDAVIAGIELTSNAQADAPPSGGRGRAQS